jgi:hypothetical protein
MTDEMKVEIDALTDAELDLVSGGDKCAKAVFAAKDKDLQAQDRMGNFEIQGLMSS